MICLTAVLSLVVADRSQENTFMCSFQPLLLQHCRNHWEGECPSNIREKGETMLRCSQKSDACRVKLQGFLVALVQNPQKWCYFYWHILGLHSFHRPPQWWRQVTTTDRWRWHQPQQHHQQQYHRHQESQQQATNMSTISRSQGPQEGKK